MKNLRRVSLFSEQAISRKELRIEPAALEFVSPYLVPRC